MLRTLLKAFGLAWLLPPPFRTVPVGDANRLANDGQALLVDIRELPEWQKTGIPAGSVPVSMSEPDFSGAVLKLADGDKSMPIAVSCFSGRRSLEASDMLVSAGFKNVINVDGGFKAWEEAGLPVQPYHG